MDEPMNDDVLIPQDDPIDDDDAAVVPPVPVDPEEDHESLDDLADKELEEDEEELDFEADDRDNF